MDQLVKLVQERTGISEDAARTAVNTVIDFLQDRLPEPIASQLRTVIDNPDKSQDLFKGLGGMLGKNP